jgi:hypothetical protein
MGISCTNFQNPLYKDFPVKFFPAVFGPLGLGWPPGGPSGCSACARGEPRYRETPRTAAARRLLTTSVFSIHVLLLYATADDALYRAAVASAVRTAAHLQPAHDG